MVRNRLHPDEIGFAFHWASILQGRGTEKQNGSTFRVIKCPYRLLVTKGEINFVVSAAQASNSLPIATLSAAMGNIYILRNLYLE